MLHLLRGIVISKGDDFFILETGNFAFKVFTHERTLQNLPSSGKVKLFCYLYVRDDHIELYGFLDERELKLFEMLDAVIGIGPKTALGILGVDTVERIIAAIIERRTDFLTRMSGVGKKTAERVILELQNKLHLPKTEKITKTMDIDVDIEEALVKLGYMRQEVKDALSKLGSKPERLEDRFKETFKRLSRCRFYTLSIIGFGHGQEVLFTEGRAGSCL